MIIKPQGDWLLIKPLNDEVKYGMLHLPDTAKSKANSGTVMAAGQWTETVKAGDWVVFSRKQGQDYVTETGEELVFVREGGVFVIIDEDKDEPVC